MRLAWVVGARGLLGSAISRTLATDGVALFTPTERFAWTDEDRLALQIIEAVAEFSAAARHVSRWEIYWAAGVGTMASTDESLAPETRTLERILVCLHANAGLMSMDGCIVFASSAGAIYGACQDEVITENSLPAPGNAYGRAKLQQECLLQDFGALRPQCAVLLARISTLYGVGQSVGKPQGLLTHMARCIVRNRPIGIFVPIDTIRDYIFADDAAAAMIDTMREGLEAAPCTLVKIIASGRPTTIAEIISIFKRIAKKSPRITTSASAASRMYSRRVQFCSIVCGGPRPRKLRSLTVGIAQLLWAERALHAKPGLR